GHAVLEVRHSQMGRIPQAQRHGGDPVHRRVHAASAGRAVSLSSPGRDGVPVGLCGGHFPGPAGARPCDALCGARPAVHDPHRRTDRARRVAGAHPLGGDGARPDRLGTGAPLARLCDPARSRTAQSLRRSKANTAASRTRLSTRTRLRSRPASRPGFCFRMQRRRRCWTRSIARLNSGRSRSCGDGCSARRWSRCSAGPLPPNATRGRLSPVPWLREAEMNRRYAARLRALLNVGGAAGLAALPVLDLVARLGVGKSFFVSGMLKASNWAVALELARFEYPLPGIDPTTEAVAGFLVELLGSVLLMAGFLTRPAAAAMLVLALTSQIAY